MITTILSTAVLFALLVTLMAVGVIFRGKALSGSCGGVPGSSCKCSSEKRASCESSHASAAGDEDNPLKQLRG